MIKRYGEGLPDMRPQRKPGARRAVWFLAIMSIWPNTIAWSVLAVAVHEDYGFIDREGRVIVPPACDRPSLGGGEWVSLERDRKQGFFNLKTRRGTGLIFDAPDLVYQAPLFASGPEPVRRAHKYGYVASDGTERIPFQFEAAGQFSENGLARVSIDHRWGYIDRLGKLSIPPRFEAATDFDKRGHALVKIDGNWGAINGKGRIVIPASYERLRLPETGDLVIATKGGHVGAVDLNGKVRVPFVFADISPFGENGLAAANDGHHWGFIDRHGTFVIAPIYSAASGFQQQHRPAFDPYLRAPLGMARVDLTDTSGLPFSIFIDARGHAIWKSPLGLTVNRIDETGLYVMFDERKMATSPWRLGRSGLLSPKFPDAITYFDLIDRSEAFGLIPVMQDGKWGYVDGKRHFVIPPTSESATPFSADGTAIVTSRKGHVRRAAFIDREGRVVMQTAFEGASNFTASGFAQIFLTHLEGQPHPLPAEQCGISAGIAAPITATNGSASNGNQRE